MGKLFEGLNKGLYFLLICVGILLIFILFKLMLHQIDERKTITKNGKLYTAFLAVIWSIGLAVLYSVMKDEVDISGSITGFIVSLAATFVGRAVYYIERKRKRIKDIQDIINHVVSQNNPQNKEILEDYRKNLREIENE
jgi:hypothetical protein